VQSNADGCNIATVADNAQIDRFPAIPTVFCNSETGLPFGHCLVCDCKLQEQQFPYSVERAIRHYPEMGIDAVVFEYGICTPCVLQLDNQISTETKTAIIGYFQQHFNADARPEWDGEDSEHPFDVEEWIGTCAIKGYARHELHEYSLYAKCIGDRIIPQVVPYMICGEAQDEVVQLFSKKSLGFFDDFTDRYFTGPPELKELFKGRPILV